MNKRGSSLYWLIIYFLLYFTWQFIHFIPVFSIMVLGAALVLIILSRKRLIIDKRAFVLILYIAFTSFMYYIFINNIRYWNVIDNSIKILIMLLFSDVIKDFDCLSKRSFVKVVIIGYTFTNISTLINSIISPEIIRSSAYTSVKSNIIFGMGGYDYIYGLVIVNILVVSLLLFEKNINYRGMLIAFVILNSVTLTMSGFTTVAILNLVFIAVIFAINSKLSAFIALIVGAISYANFSNILLFVSKLSFLPDTFKGRIQEFAIYFSNHSGDLYYFSSEGSRGARMERSWRIFLRNPIFGGFAAHDIDGLGEHTEWIDRLAEFGILIVAIILFFWILQYRYCLINTQNKKSFRFATHFSFLYFFVLGFLNPCSYQCTVFPLIVILPNLYNLLNTTDKCKEV